MDLIVQLLQLLLSPLHKLLKRSLGKIRIWRLQRSLQTPPLSDEEAINIVQAVLTGSVSKVKVYRNIDSSRLFIAALVRPNKEALPLVAILEQVGRTYRALWTSDDVAFDSIRSLDVVDTDRDGYHEVVVASESWGTGARSWTVTAYFHRVHQAYQLTEDLQHQDLAGPIVPSVTFYPTPPQEIRETLELMAAERELLQPLPRIDWDSPEFAIPRWHRDNGATPNGYLHLVFYPGTPPRAPVLSEIVKAPDILTWSSIVTSYDDGHIVWTAYFKNPLVGYIKSENRWFIAYSPANMYDWVIALTHDGKRIWFSTHSSAPGIWSFEFASSILLHHRQIGTVVLPQEPELTFAEGILRLGSTTSLTTAELERACAEHPQVSFPTRVPKRIL